MWFGRRRRPGRGGGQEVPPAEGRLILEAIAELGDELQLAAQARGQSPEALAADLLERGLEQEAMRAQAEAALRALTQREQQVTWLATRGWTNRRIAEALVVSPETVKTHVAHVLEKLGVRSKIELRVLLLDLGVRWWEGGDDRQDADRIRRHSRVGRDRPARFERAAPPATRSPAPADERHDPFGGT